MRILHTSDWHLGRGFGPVSLADHQQAFLDWLVEVCATERIDLVVVAGDVFDRAIAPTEALVMFRDAVRRILATGARLAVITGNHDGFDRVATYGELLDASGAFVRGGYHSIGEVLTLEFPDGPLDLVLLPFLDPHLAPDHLDHDGGGEHEAAADVFERRIRRTHQSVLRSAIAACGPGRRSPRSLAVSHAFVTGGRVTDSERDLAVGGTGTVEAALFHGFSYTALGHLHRPQQVGGSAMLRYSGTPLPYSFSEDHPKSVVLVDMAADGRCEVHEVPVPVGRAVCTLRGTIDDLVTRDPDPVVEASFVRAILTDRGVVLDAKRRLAERYPHVVEIVPLPFDDAERRAGAPAATSQWSPIEAVDAFWRASAGAPPDQGERELLHEAIAAASSKLAERVAAS
jgi:DNA repair protein SbcD/Mre11